ncbi:hypothetical protein [Sulfuracidifex metallicus]|uniref:hypothetical protein n=1 Tax=Sulfuracidifex metallicus TaxID=47303 RepID=UPI002273B031|nr:hypothetical protein [Sulfuracidifex metallicus]MCY0849708.1 hypothetical protein [Sulfuracidifex metallicus]
MRNFSSKLGIKENLIALTLFASIYALLELGMQWNPSKDPASPQWMKDVFSPLISLYFYRVIYSVIFFYPAYLASRKLISIDTLWYFIYASTMEDVLYWIFDLKEPYQWAWFYPVFHGLPIDDLIGFIFLALTFKYLKR